MAKVLIVDDDVEFTTMLERILSKLGFETTAINVSSKAVQMANHILPDLILLDIMMPDINGIDLCKMLQSFPNLQHIPVAIVSALNDNGSKRDAFNAGAKEFITKPVFIDEFTKKIKKLISEKQ
jgi:CheY-like chemotaxis protein